MPQFAQSRRPHRAGEWTEAKAVTFIVTLAASRSVTLAAARAGMSRKAAYSLKHRNPSFAAAWNAAIAAAGGDKVDEADNPRIGRAQGNKSSSRMSRVADANSRDRFFATPWNWPVESGWSTLARAAALP